MAHRIRDTNTLAAISRLLVAVAVLIAINIGCNPSDKIVNLHDLSPAESLLCHTPFIGLETELRDPPPETARLVITDESVEGWLSPDENVLRFPVELRGNARLSFKIGVLSEKTVPLSDIIFRIKYNRKSGDTGSRNGNIGDDVIEIHPSVADWNSVWVNVDTPLDFHAPGKVELEFITSGPGSIDPEIEILWGQPTIYYPEKRRHRNVLLIGIDTLRGDGIEPYGERLGITPELSEFMKSATLFSQARAQASWTLPSFASMITGLHPSRINPTISSDLLPDHVTTLGEILLPLGYATTTICGNPHLGNSVSGFHQGMESLWYVYDSSPQKATVKAQDFITRSRDRDWFCFLHIMDPHTPYNPPKNLAERFCDPEYTGSIGLSFDLGEEWKRSYDIPQDDDIRHIRNLYDGEVANLDDALEELFSFITEIDLMDDTLIIFASDHGEEFYEHGKFEHGHTLYDELVHVPLIVHGPGFPKDTEIDTCVGNTDIFPTVLDFIDLPIPSELPGTPLQDVISGKVDNNRLIFGEESLLRQISHQKFAVEWPYKCILDFFTGEASLFHLVNDPNETIDISGSHPETCEFLSEKMIVNMLPIRTMLVMILIGDPHENRHTFSGTITISDGVKDIKPVRGSSKGEEDIWELEENTISFQVTNPQGDKFNFKAYAILLENEHCSMEVSLLVDGETVPDRFYPYGNSTPEPSGLATVNIDDMPWPAQIPSDAMVRPAACYILSIPGFPGDLEGIEFENVELDPETKEQLRALGYIN